MSALPPANLKSTGLKMSVKPSSFAGDCSEPATIETSNPPHPPEEAEQGDTFVKQEKAPVSPPSRIEPEPLPEPVVAPKQEETLPAEATEPSQPIARRQMPRLDRFSVHSDQSRDNPIGENRMNGNTPVSVSKKPDALALTTLIGSIGFLIGGGIGVLSCLTRQDKCDPEDFVGQAFNTLGGVFGIATAGVLWRKKYQYQLRKAQQSAAPQRGAGMV